MNSSAARPIWILSVDDLPRKVAPARYRVKTTAGEFRTITISKRRRQVVDALCANDLYCASTVRIGDAVFRLKEDFGQFHERRTLDNGRAYYTLAHPVEFLGEVTEVSRAKKEVV